MVGLSPPPVIMIPEIVEQHAEELAFLWVLRERAVHAAHYTLEDLVELDQRIEAHLDGLRVASDAGWEIAARELAWREPGEVFAAALLAVESPVTSRIEAVEELAVSDASLARGLISALGWQPFDLVRERVELLLSSGDPARQRIGIRAAALHRWAGVGDLPEGSVAEECRAPLLRAFGELGLVQRLDRCLEALPSDDRERSFWAAWSATLLGSGAGLELLRGEALGAGPRSAASLRLAGRCLPADEARAWCRELASAPDRRRETLQLAGSLGDPALVPLLFEQMAVPELARVAGEALTEITGADLERLQLDGDAPADFESGPSGEADDDDVAVPDDEDLPWPVAERVEAWWAESRGRFEEGQRYLLGRPVSPACATWALAGARQRQRAAAAIELRRIEPGAPLFEVRAPAARQRALLAE